MVKSGIAQPVLPYSKETTGMRTIVRILFEEPRNLEFAKTRMFTVKV